ncbi:MAG: beta-glucosidase [Acidimicrobiales bacterium]|nr:beta-glucosidase [Acidimicrobiales bacterium]
MVLSREQFGDDFTWGVAHASYQVEGAWNEDGKGESIWDTFTRRRGKIRDRSDGTVACDFYHRYSEDTRLVADLGFGAQRFSISWPRVLPEGTGRVNQKGLDFYRRVVDECLAADVEPWVTLYHWDLPEVLQQRGGWANRDVVGWFGEYVDVVAAALADRVEHWMVFNEPCSFLLGGYLSGVHAPGVRSLRKFLGATHHTNLSQAAGAAALRARSSDLQVGTTHIITPMVPSGTSERHLRAAASIDAFANRVYIEPNLGLGYPVDDAPLLRGVDRWVRPGDDSAIRVDWDFVGVQYYQRLPVHAVPIPLLRGVPWPRRDHRSYDITAMGWEVQPEGLYDALAKVHAYDPDLRLFVTENGVAVPDRIEDGQVHDPRRIDFYRRHLEQVLRAQSDGIGVDGYFCWSLMDNFEWAEGYVPRFGLVRVDFDTQQRTVKDSGRWFEQLLTANPTAR